jgi:ligand-binding SRPBCC domain-containing protein
MIYQIFREQTVPAPINVVWSYFSEPKNLNEITPPDMNFLIINDGGGKMYQGQLIEYRIQFIPYFKSKWLTEIAHVREQNYFVDVQQIGPYRFWYHEHIFDRVGNGTNIRDRVTYSLPFGIIGDIVHTIWVGKRLKSIFDYRSKKMAAIF